MSNPDPFAPKPRDEDEAHGSKGPNIALIFSLIGLALLIAIAVAAFIVLPFYHRR
jgi:hypothetical protein